MLRSGSTPRRSNDENWGGDIPWVSAKSLHRFLIDDAKEYVTETGASKARIMPKDTVLVLVRGMRLAKEFPVGITQTSVTFNQDVKALTPKEGVDPLYLAYALKATEDRAMNWSSKTTHGTLRLTTPRLKELPIPVLSLEKQRRIASLLGDWDRALAQTDALLEAKRERLRGLRQRLLDGGERFPAFDAPWKKRTLGNVFAEREDTGNGHLDLLAVTMDEGVIRRDQLDRRDTSSSDKSDYQRAAAGDLVYNSMRMWQGVSGIAREEGIVSPAYTVCIPGDDVEASFIRHLFRHPPVVNLFRRYSQGLTSDTWKLRFEHFAQIEVGMPPLEEQRRIAAVLDTAEAEIHRLKQKRAALKRQKKGLMQRLLTGPVRTV